MPLVVQFYPSRYRPLACGDSLALIQGVEDIHPFPGAGHENDFAHELLNVWVLVSPVGALPQPVGFVAHGPHLRGKVRHQLRQVFLGGQKVQFPRPGQVIQFVGPSHAHGMVVNPIFVFTEARRFGSKVGNAPLESEHQTRHVAGELNVVVGISGPILNRSGHGLVPFLSNPLR